MTGTKSLFNEQADEFLPAIDRPEPMLWVRRVVIVEQLAPLVDPIREIEFRRGMNIIATAKPNEDADGPVGHNVGKTLLTRLLRYCLGEQTYARETVRKAIAKALPSAFVICEVVVNKVCWVVARPIGEERQSAAKCIQAQDWRAILSEDNGADRLSRFNEVVDQATVAQFNETTLPHVNRPIRWLDLLAWLSRDQYCRYRHPLEWRSTWTESGTADLHDEDASVLIRLVMDLLDQEETQLIQTHKQLLKEKNDKAAEVVRLEQELGQTRRFLETRLGIDGETLTDDLFGDAARQQADIRKSTLQAELETFDSDAEWQALVGRFEEAKQNVAKKQQEIATREADRQTAEGEIEQHRTSSRDDLAASLADLGNPCPLPPHECPLKDPTQQPGQIHPLRQMHISNLAADIQSLDQTLAGLRDEHTELVAVRETITGQFHDRQIERRAKEQQLRGKLSVAEALLAEATAFRASQRQFQKATGDLAKLEQRIEQSRQSHHSARAQVAQRQVTLNSHFNRALKALVGATSEGSIALDMRGLHLQFGDQDSSLGEALATSETVLSLDLACLSAGISGLGFLPRFAIHDSPREADLEPHIYARLFRFLKVFEDSFGDNEPSFQYIITTTTPPPKELATAPYVRLTLDARQNGGLLLQRKF